MGKAVLISIRPEWCEKIANGEKTIEVRKTRPKLKTPFKCYIYCTEPNTHDPHKFLEIHGEDGKIRRGNGKVIGEFMCDWTEATCGWRLKGKTGFLAKRTERETIMPEMACLSIEEMEKYAGGENRCLYGWHISILVIYDKPKELGEFRIPCKEYERDNPGCGGCDYYRSMGEYPAECDCDGLKPVTRAPQSWCYVEVLHE